DKQNNLQLPNTSSQTQLTGQHWLDISLGSDVSFHVIKLAAQKDSDLLRERNRFRPGQEDDFNIRNPEDQIQTQLDATNTFTLFLVCVGSVSLLVGGIGIMNVMLVSVTERTREIGIRMAVGATEAEVQFQFLSESV